MTEDKNMTENSPNERNGNDPETIGFTITEKTIKSLQDSKNTLRSIRSEARISKIFKEQAKLEKLSRSVFRNDLEKLEKARKQFSEMPKFTGVAAGLGNLNCLSIADSFAAAAGVQPHKRSISAALGRSIKDTADFARISKLGSIASHEGPKHWATPQREDLPLPFFDDIARAEPQQVELTDTASIERAEEVEMKIRQVLETTRYLVRVNGVDFSEESQLKIDRRGPHFTFDGYVNGEPITVMGHVMGLTFTLAAYRKGLHLVDDDTEE